MLWMKTLTHILEKNNSSLMGSATGTVLVGEYTTAVETMDDLFLNTDNLAHIKPIHNNDLVSINRKIG